MGVSDYLGRWRLRGYRAQIGLHSAAADVEVTRDLPCAITVKNVGTRIWEAGGDHPVRLSYHWRLGEQAIEGIRFSLPADMRPGEQATLDCAVPAPSVEGRYVLEFDLVRELVGWFTRAGSPTLSIERTLLNYDYETTYRQADLEKDYWTVVGPTTKDEYEYLGRHKRETLIALGMTEHARILDVGCGTGQLAEALEDYLADDAVFYGTDIAQGAVTFCQQKFRRPNFFFFKNDMSRVPIEGRHFDIIFLGSVFTHMYPDEIQAMLIDLKRLLAPTGQLVADVFVADVPAFTGSRSRVQMNQQLIEGVFDRTGLRFEARGRMVLPDGGQRLGYVFRL